MSIFNAIIIFAIGLFIYALFTQFIPEIKHNRRKNFNNNQISEKYTSSYQAKYLLTKNEWYEYKKLKIYAEALNLIICPKVRLLDIIEPRKGEGNYKTLLYKIQSKHVDFVLCDQSLRIKAILEIDDASHIKQSRHERDQFVDEILNSVGYKVIRTNSITEETLLSLMENHVPQEQAQVELKQ